MSVCWHKATDFTRLGKPKKVVRSNPQTGRRFRSGFYPIITPLGPWEPTSLLSSSWINAEKLYHLYN